LYQRTDATGPSLPVVDDFLTEGFLAPDVLGPGAATVLDFVGFIVAALPFAGTNCFGCTGVCLGTL